MNGFNWADLSVIAGLLVSGVALVLRGIKQVRDDNKAFLAGFEARLAAVEKAVVTLGADKVDKRDWVRESLSTRNKVDKVLEGLAGLSGKIDAEFGVAAAINRIADRMAEKQS